MKGTFQKVWGEGGTMQICLDFIIIWKLTAAFATG